jgi:hypothetical protein
VADLLVVDGDPLTDVELLRRREQLWLVLTGGRPVAGRALDAPSVVVAPAPALTRPRCRSPTPAASRPG